MKPWRPSKKRREELARKRAREEAASPPPPPPAPIHGVKPIRIYMTYLAVLPVLLVVPMLLVTSDPETTFPVMREGARRLGVMRERPATELTPPSPAPPVEDVELLVRLKTTIRDTALNWNDRRLAAQELTELQGIQAEALLLELSFSGEPKIRKLSLPGLVRRLPQPKAEEALFRLINDPVPQVAAAAAQELGTNPEQGEGLLLYRLRSRDNPGMVHVACMEALARVGTPQSLPVLSSWLAEGSGVGDAAGFGIRTICQRHKLELPKGLPPLDPLEQQ